MFYAFFKKINKKNFLLRINIQFLSKSVDSQDMFQLRHSFQKHIFLQKHSQGWDQFLMQFSILFLPLFRFRIDFEMNHRKLSTDSHTKLARHTYSPSIVDLHEQAEDWRRRTRNIETMNKPQYYTRANSKANLHEELGTSRVMRDSFYSPRPTVGLSQPMSRARPPSNTGSPRCENIKISLNFNPNQQPDFQRQLAHKQNELQIILSQYQHYKTTLERKIQGLTRNDYSQRQQISQLEIIIRELKSRLATRNNSPRYDKSQFQSPDQSFENFNEKLRNQLVKEVVNGEVLQMNTPPLIRMKGSATALTTAERTPMRSSKLGKVQAKRNTELTEEKMSSMFDQCTESLTRLHTAPYQKLKTEKPIYSDKMIETMPEDTSRLQSLESSCRSLEKDKRSLEKELSFVKSQLSRMTIESQKQKEEIVEMESKLYVAQLANSKQNRELQLQIQDLNSHIEQLNGEIGELTANLDKMADAVLQKQIQNQQLAERNEQFQLENQTMKEMINEQQQKLRQLSQTQVNVEAICSQNKNLIQQMSKLQCEYEHLQVQVEELRNIKEEVSKIKSNNLQLMVQSSNQIETIKKLTDKSKKIEQAIAKLIGDTQNEVQAKQDPQKTTTLVTEASEKQGPQMFRVEESFVTDGPTSHESHLKVTEDLTQNLNSILEKLEKLKDKSNTTKQEQLQQEEDRKLELEDMKQQIESLNRQLDQQRSLTNELLLQTKQMRKAIETLTKQNDQLISKSNSTNNKNHVTIKQSQKFEDPVIQSVERQPYRNKTLPPNKLLNTIEEHPDEDTQQNLPKGGSLKFLHQMSNMIKMRRSSAGVSKSDQPKQESRQQIQVKTPSKPRPSISSPSQPVQANTSPDSRLPSRLLLQTMTFKELSYTLLADFCDKNDQRSQFLNVIQELVRRYFELQSGIAKTMMSFLNSMYSFPNHTFLLEKSDTLLREIREYTESARNQVKLLEEAIEEYVSNIKPAFAGYTDQDQEGDLSLSKNNQLKQETPKKVSVDKNEKRDSPLRQLLAEGLVKSITKLKSRSSISSSSSKNSENLRVY